LFAQFVLERYTDDIKAYRCGLTLFGFFISSAVGTE